jgi:hypothetical protein
MFKKLNTQVKKNAIKSKSTKFKSLKERKELESEVVFGNLLEELASLKIEKAYEDEKEKK